KSPWECLDVKLHTRLPERLLGFLAIVASLLGASPCGAEEVRVTVVVILATDRNNAVAHELKCIAQEVQKKYPHLTGFCLEQITRKSLPVGKSEKFALVDEEVATVLVRHGADSNNRVGLTMKAPLQGEIQYTTCCGKFLPIVTRYETKERDRL